MLRGRLENSLKPTKDIVKASGLEIFKIFQKTLLLYSIDDLSIRKTKKSFIKKWLNATFLHSLAHFCCVQWRHRGSTRACEIIWGWKTFLISILMGLLLIPSYTTLPHATLVVKYLYLFFLKKKCYEIPDKSSYIWKYIKNYRLTSYFSCKYTFQVG